MYSSINNQFVFTIECDLLLTCKYNNINQLGYENMAGFWGNIQSTINETKRYLLELEFPQARTRISHTTAMCTSKLGIGSFAENIWYGLEKRPDPHPKVVLQGFWRTVWRIVFRYFTKQERSICLFACFGETCFVKQQSNIVISQNMSFRGDRRL
jgi:hypothetical protein